MLLRVKWIVFVLAVFLPISFVSAAAPIPTSARERKLVEQKADNKRWLKEAQTRERNYYTKAESYYKQKLYVRAEKWYEKVLDVRYKEWPIKERGSGSRRREVPASKAVRKRMDTNYSSKAKVRLAGMGKLVAKKKEARQKEALGALKEKAELALMLDDQAKAYKLYGDVVKQAASMGESKMTVRYCLDMLKQQKAILDKAGKPLDEIGKLIEKKKVTDALKRLGEYEEKYAALMDLAPELKERYQGYMENPEVRTETREQQCLARVTTGDTALLRGDFLTAKRHYEAAMGMYPGTVAAKSAARKLAQLLENPKIVAVIAEQQMERECAPLLARARYFFRMQENANAAKVCKQVIAKYPKTKWATEAQKLLDKMK